MYVTSYQIGAIGENRNNCLGCFDCEFPSNVISVALSMIFTTLSFLTLSIVPAIVCSIGAIGAIILIRWLICSDATTARDFRHCCIVRKHSPTESQHLYNNHNHGFAALQSPRAPISSLQSQGFSRPPIFSGTRQPAHSTMHRRTRSSGISNTTVEIHVQPPPTTITDARNFPPSRAPVNPRYPT